MNSRDNRTFAMNHSKVLELGGIVFGGGVGDRISCLVFKDGKLSLGCSWRFL